MKLAEVLRTSAFGVSFWHGKEKDMRDDERKVYQYIGEHDGVAMSMADVGAIVGGTEKTGRRIIRNLTAAGAIERRDAIGAASRFFCTCGTQSRIGEQSQIPLEAPRPAGTGMFGSVEDWEDILTALGAESWIKESEIKKPSEAIVFWSDGTQTEYTIEPIGGGGIKVS